MEHFVTFLTLAFFSLPNFTYLYHGDQATDFAEDNVLNLQNLSPANCFDLYMAEEEVKNFAPISEMANELADWLEADSSSDEQAAVRFLYPNGQIVPPQLEEQPILDVLLQTLFGIGVFSLAEDFLDNLPSIPAVVKTKRLIRRTKEQSKTIPAYHYKRPNLQVARVEVSLKKGVKKPLKYDLQPLDLAAVGVDEQQSAFNFKQKERFTAILSKTVSANVQKAVKKVYNNTNISLGSIKSDLGEFAASLGTALSDYATIQLILDTIWQKLAEEQIPLSTKPAYQSGDLRNFFAGPAELYYSLPIKLAPGKYKVQIKYYDESNNQLSKSKSVLTVEAGQRYLIVPEQGE